MFTSMNTLRQGRRETEVYAPLACLRCGKSNSPDSKFCNWCGLALDIRHALEADQRKEDLKDKIDELSTELAKSPEVLDMLLNAVQLMKGGQRERSFGRSSAQLDMDAGERYGFSHC